MATIATRPAGLQRKLVVRALLTPVLMGVLTFIGAGRLDYWQGWLYLGMTIGVLAVTWYALRQNTALIEERFAPGEGMKTWDKVYFALSTLLYVILLTVSLLDAGRYGWTPALPWWAYAAGCAAFLGGNAIFLWAKTANRYFSSVVRIQTDRGHAVCDQGPYRFVRHPGYVGGLLFGAVTPLVLGSLWGLIPSMLASLLLVWRTAMEDSTLQAELPGYAEYARRVRYRLIPGVW